MNYVQKIKLLRVDKILDERLEVLCDVSRFTYNFLLAKSITYSNETKKHPFLKIIYEFQKEFRHLVRDSIMHDKDGVIYHEDF